jgi:AcrR family transcriptional regulator
MTAASARVSAANARVSSETVQVQGVSAGDQAHTARGPRSRASARRREAILDAALAVAATGGYDAVHMRTVAERVGIAVGTLYRYFPAKTHLLVAALIREFQRLDASGDWATGACTPQQRLDRLTEHLHDRWQRDPLLTAAMTRAFVMADTRGAAELDRAAAAIETLLARTLAGGEPTPADLQVAGIVADIWLANLVAFISDRVSAAETRDRIDRATRRVVHQANAGGTTPERYN